jgi:hypothetical protein
VESKICAVECHAARSVSESLVYEKAGNTSTLHLPLV